MSSVRQQRDRVYLRCLPTAIPFSSSVFLADHPMPSARRASGGRPHLKFHESWNNLCTASNAADLNVAAMQDIQAARSPRARQQGPAKSR
jgi:hypothetical protein